MIKPIRLVALDLDRTLLARSDSLLSPYCLATLRDIQAKGVHIAVITGRSTQSALPYAREIGNGVSLITRNGSVARYLSWQNAPVLCALSPTAIERSIHAGHHYGLDLVFTESHDEGEAFLLSRHSRLGSAVVDAKAQQKGAPYSLYQAGLQFRKITRLGVFGPSENADLSAAHFAAILGAEMECHVIDEHIDSRIQVRKLGLSQAGATKGLALAELARRLDIPRQAVMAIGDSFHDVSMLDYAGVPVIVANADETARKPLYHVARSVDDEGVANILHEMILKPQAWAPAS